MGCKRFKERPRIGIFGFSKRTEKLATRSLMCTWECLTLNEPSPRVSYAFSLWCFLTNDVRDLAGVVKRLRWSRADSLKLLLHNFMTGTLFFGAAFNFQSRNFLVSLWLQPDYPIKCRVLPVLLSLCFDLSQSQLFQEPWRNKTFST